MWTLVDYEMSFFKMHAIGLLCVWVWMVWGGRQVLLCQCEVVWGCEVVGVCV